MRVLEFGAVPIVKATYPAQTVFVGTGADPVEAPGSTSFDFSLGRLRQVRALLNDSSFDAIFVTRTSTRRSGFDAVVRLIANRRVARRGVPALRIFGDRMLRFGAAAPIIVFDPSDAAFVPRNAVWLWQRAAVVFKRELPLDRWQMFTGTVHGDLPTPRFRRIARYRGIVEKVEPMSLGLSAEAEAAIPQQLPPKTVDVFFAGNSQANSWLREKGLQELAALRVSGAGIDIDVAETRLPHREFLHRCAQARLVWSPSGLGHDTFRLYEAAACGAVPLVSRPSILQYAPFKEGETGFFYDPEEGGLIAAIRRALERRSSLVAMGLAARTHVLAHHTLRARVDHMLAAASLRGR